MHKLRVRSYRRVDKKDRIWLHRSLHISEETDTGTWQRNGNYSVYTENALTGLKAPVESLPEKTPSLLVTQAKSLPVILKASLVLVHSRHVRRPVGSPAKYITSMAVCCSRCRKLSSGLLMSLLTGLNVSTSSPNSPWSFFFNREARIAY